MKKRALLGFVLAVAYAVFILLFPHATPRLTGLETDLTMMYVNGASALGDLIAGRGATARDSLLWPDVNPFLAHGLGYPLALWVFALPLSNPVPAWSYFTAAKLVSILAAAAVIVLAFVWLGRLPGCVAVAALATSPLFFRLSYLGCTDLFAAALVLWAAFCLAGNRSLPGGILYALAVVSRYEYLLFLPFVIWWIFRDGRKEESTPGADRGRDQGPGRGRCGLSVARPLGWFLLPVIFLLGANFLLVGLPASNVHNVAIHYLEGVDHGFQYTGAIADRYPTYWAILAADPRRTLEIFVRDLGKTTAAVAAIQMAPLLTVGAVLFLWRRKSRKTLPLVGALLVHFLVLVFTINQPGSERFFIVQILALGLLGAAMSAHYRRWYLVLLIPSLVLNLQGLAREIDTQQRSSADPFREFRGRGWSDRTILSVRACTAFVAGTRWRYWKPGIEDLYRYCQDNDIDFVHWTRPEYHHRPEYRGKFGNPAAAEPEFFAVHVNRKLGILFAVNRELADP